MLVLWIELLRVGMLDVGGASWPWFLSAEGDSL